jgi:hypothetical protein
MLQFNFEKDNGSQATRSSSAAKKMTNSRPVSGRLSLAIRK